MILDVLLFLLWRSKFLIVSWKNMPNCLRGVLTPKESVWRAKGYLPYGMLDMYSWNSGLNGPVRFRVVKAPDVIESVVSWNRVCLATL